MSGTPSDAWNHPERFSAPPADRDVVEHDIVAYLLGQRHDRPNMGNEVTMTRQRLNEAAAEIVALRERAEAELAREKQESRDYQYEVMTGRSEQHDRLVADLAAARADARVMAAECCWSRSLDTYSTRFTGEERYALLQTARTATDASGALARHAPGTGETDMKGKAS